MAVASNPLPNCEIFIRAKLAADPIVSGLVGNKIYSIMAPQGTIYPYIVFSYYTGQVSLAVGRNESVYELPEYMVKAVTKGGDTGQAHDIARALENALKNANGIATYGTESVSIQGVRLVPPRIEYAEVDTDGVRINHIGNLFRLFVSGA